MSVNILTELDCFYRHINNTGSTCQMCAFFLHCAKVVFCDEEIGLETNHARLKYCMVLQGTAGNSHLPLRLH